ncbi:kinase domain protein [Opisthorchis viverrini]|uniref:Kinase domain protein n=1 Tax=Opisthorchis viverrini TaxID=6198 RepID=A0A1S8X042_OPIVI|nr:kinase domain protein [Opisthorchis viverrini]
MTELLPTQDVDEVNHISAEVTDDSSVWGRLFPLQKKLPFIGMVLLYTHCYPHLELKDETYTFGRGEDCSFTFCSSMFDDPNQLATFSKHHFKETSYQGKLMFIQDLSSNGTFVNGTKIGFIFCDSNSEENLFPPEVTSRYTISKLLGRGACGEVRLVFERGSCEKRAMKIVQKKTFSITAKLGNGVLSRIKSEVDILMKLAHPCIIYIYDVIDTDEALYMILELVEGGELFDRIVQLGQLSEQDAKFLFLQMAIAVGYLHEHGITHRDLKPENILLTNNQNRCLIKVTDFGLSKLVDGNTMLRTFCGTPTYLAPEVLRTAGSGTYTSAIDVWSLGVILLVGYPPFTEERKDHDLQTQIVQGLYDFPDIYWKAISEEAKDLVRKMLTVEPSERLTIQDVIQHAWFDDVAIKTDVRELLNKAQTTGLAMGRSEALTKLPAVFTEDKAPVGNPVVNGSLPQSNSSLSKAPSQDDDTVLHDKSLARKRPADEDSPILTKRVTA